MTSTCVPFAHRHGCWGRGTAAAWAGSVLCVAALLMNGGCGGVPAGETLDSTVLDSDGDGFSDETEINSTPGTDPFDPSDNPLNVRDTDGDGCSNYDELNFPGFCDNDPNTPVDSDGDGFSDDFEINSIPGTDPNDPTDNPNNVRDSDGDGCSNYDELNFPGFCDNDPNTPGADAFDGYWVAEGTVESGPAVGTTGLHIQASDGRASCVSRFISDECPELNYGTPSASRPITGQNGGILVEFTMDFSECWLDACSCFVESEQFIEVTIAGFRIAGTDVYDVVIEERYLLSDVTFLSSGTLELISATPLDRCGLP